MKPKLYLFFSNGIDCGTTHSLYAMDLQSPDDKNPTIPTVTTVTTVTTVLGETSSIDITEKVTPGEPKRSVIDPLLRFTAPFWPHNMTCARVGKKLYFFGGYNDGSDPFLPSPKDRYPTAVYSLDLPSTSIGSLQKYRDRPEEVMTTCPSMLSGKINPLTSFTADNKLFVLSGCDTCKFTGNKFKQFEILEDGNKWVYGEDPPFHNLCDLVSYVNLNNKKVIVIGHTLEGRALKETTCIYEYDIQSNRWAELYTGCCTGLENIPCYQFEQGGQFIGDKFYSMVLGKSKRGLPLPVIVPVSVPNYQEDVENKNGKMDSSLLSEKWFDVLPYSIRSPCLLHTLTRVRDNILCHVQVGPPVHPGRSEEHWNGDQCYISATQFSVLGDLGEYLNSAHYVKITDGSRFNIVAAYVI